MQITLAHPGSRPHPYFRCQLCLSRVHKCLRMGCANALSLAHSAMPMELVPAVRVVGANLRPDQPLSDRWVPRPTALSGARGSHSLQDSTSMAEPLATRA